MSESVKVANDLPTIEAARADAGPLGLGSRTTSMGSYGYLRAGNHDLLYWKNGVDDNVTTIFTERDRLEQPAAGAEGDDDEGRHAYRCSLGAAIDRLELLGFTERRARAYFDSWIGGQLRAAREHFAPDNADRFEGNDAYYAQRISLFEHLTFDEWGRALRYVLENDIFGPARDNENLTPAQKFVVDDEDSIRGYPPFDPRYFVRAALIALSDAPYLELNLTDLVAGGWYEKNEPVVANSRDALVEHLPHDRKVILLTEGSSDIRILRRAVECVAPHLQDYFTFFDFQATRARGGAPAVVETLKALAAARISDRIVALFDNDTAAHAALRALSGIQLPSNMRYITYPDLELAKDYPTLGPNGLARMNVNGMAASIEMYLGRDVLETAGELTPVQWRGYDETLGRYQGELLNKSALQERYFALTSAWMAEPSSHPNRDWTGMKAILNAIRAAANG